MSLKIYNLEIKPITYIHIGSGIELDPLNYVIKDNIFYAFELEKLFSLWDEKKKEEFVKLTDKNDLIKIKDFVRVNFINECVLYKIEIDRKLSEKYNEKIYDINNSLYIGEHIKNKINYEPYIPGSSLKGSIRTAVLNYFEAENENIKLENNLLKYRKELFEEDTKYNAKRDPFRFIFVEDVNIDKENLVIKEIKNFKPDRTTDIINMDITKELISGGDKTFKAVIKINENMMNKNDIRYNNNDKKEKSKKYVTIWKKLKKNIDINLIRDACNVFYMAVYLYEKEKFYDKLCDKYIELKDYYKKLDDIINSIDIKNEFLIRIGRYSHIEAITFNKNFNPIVKTYGNSRFIVDGKYPLGWAIIKINDNNLEKPNEKRIKDDINYFKIMINNKIENLNNDNNKELQGSRLGDNLEKINVTKTDKKNAKNKNNLINDFNNLKKMIGKEVEGKITNIVRNLGIFVNIYNNHDGLIHISKLNNKLNYFKKGMKVKVRIEDVYKDTKKNKINIILKLI